MRFGYLLLAMVLLGVADSLTSPYLALFAADEAHLSPVRVGVLASAVGLGGIVISTWLGRRFDRAPTRAYVLLACCGGAAGHALLTVTRSFELLLVLSLTLLGVVAVGFPQLFALARHSFRNGEQARRGAPILRSGWSLAWALGPLAGSAILARAGYHGLFWATTAILLVTALVVLALPGGGSFVEEQAHGDTRMVPRASVALLTLSIALFFTAMCAGSIALPFYATRELALPSASVGLLYSACAAVEVLVSLGLAFLPNRRWAVPGGMLLMVGYFVITALADGMTTLVLAQGARGAAIAVVGAVGLVYFQDLMAPATGRATTLFSNAGTAGMLISGILAGLWMEFFSYRVTLVLCGGTAALGALVFLAGQRILNAETARPGLRDRAGR